jgi:glucose-6-phosphate 1-dehydrogenase
VPTPMTLVLFGATGDLARGKLWPALHDLADSGRLPEELSVLGISRSASTEELRELAAEHGPGGARLESSERWQQLLEATEVVNGAADDPELYERLDEALGDREGDRLTYLSVAPSLFAEIGGRLAGIGLGREAGAASRLVIEKPFGEDLASARELRAALHEHFDEEQLLRIDHYLGKEAAQNLLVLRFVNGIFEPLWDRRSIESIQVTVAEDGVEDGSSTDTFAALRVEVDSWRWAGVPCYLRTGKRMAAKAAEIAVAFRPSPHMPFEGAEGWAGANRLIIGIQPGEKVRLHVTGKRPGDGLELVKVELDFDAGEAAERDAPEAYERLLGDAIAGDTTWFTSGDEVEAQWAAIEPLLRDRPEPVPYEPGSAGPDEARDIPGRDGRRWRPLPDSG